MAIAIPSIAATYDLDALLDAFSTWYHLYSANVTIGPATTLADLTESAWPGYAAKEVTSWTPATINGQVSESLADPLLWKLTTTGGPYFVYGYYVTDGPTGPLIWCEARAAGPIKMATAGDPCEVLPRLTYRQDPVPE